MNVNNSNIEDHVRKEDGDNRKEDTSGGSNITKEFDAILEDIKNNW